MGATTRRTEIHYTETVTEEHDLFDLAGPLGLDGCVFAEGEPWDDDDLEGGGDEGLEELDGRFRAPETDKPIAEMNNKELGAFGEDLACRYLARRGYEILERNYRCPEGEADIVAYDPADDAVVLIEVKTRRRASVEGGYPEEAVDAKKRRRYRRIAACYLMDNFPTPCARFDTVGIVVDRDGFVEVAHAAGAFDWEAER